MTDDIIRDACKQKGISTRELALKARMKTSRIAYISADLAPK